MTMVSLKRRKEIAIKDCTFIWLADKKPGEESEIFRRLEKKGVMVRRKFGRVIAWYVSEDDFSNLPLRHFQ